jgi:hypothetical protein
VAPNVRTFLFLAKNIIIIAVVCQIDIYIFSIAVVVNSDAFQSMISSLPFSSPLLSSPLLSSPQPFQIVFGGFNSTGTTRRNFTICSTSLPATR